MTPEPDPNLRRFWIQLRPEDAKVHRLGYGVTAYSRPDAEAILQRVVFDGLPMPEVDNVTEDVDVRDLDQGHVIPNMGVVVWRGVWYPSGYTEWMPAREIERRIDLTNIDLDNIAAAVDARRPAWAQAGISVRPVTWVDHDAEWPAPLSTDRAAIAAPRSIGFCLDGPGSAETEFVVYAAGWADTDFVTEQGGPVSSGYVELYTADEFVAVMDRIVAQVRRAVAGS